MRLGAFWDRWKAPNHVYAQAGGKSALKTRLTKLFPRLAGLRLSRLTARRRSPLWGHQRRGIFFVPRLTNSKQRKNRLPTPSTADHLLYSEACDLSDAVG